MRNGKIPILQEHIITFINPKGNVYDTTALRKGQLLYVHIEDL
jgi:hypothetical protein